MRRESGGVWLWLSLIFAACCAANTVADERPNLIFILSDDQGIEAIEGSAWPNQLDCHTPRLANLAQSGRTFSVARVNSKCSPTRAAVLTGRYAFRTGVTDRLAVTPDRGSFSLQGHETTIAEALQRRGYYTMLIGKWHVGNGGVNGESPEQQGFDSYLSHLDLLPMDHPEQVGDELITALVDEAVATVKTRPDPEAPYALFFWPYDVHGRRSDASGYRWWRVDERLLPSGEPYYAPRNESQRNRYRATVEALDTELARMLFELGVIDEEDGYIDASDTLTIFMSDNGTDPNVSIARHRAKGTVYELGIRVPLFAFGERVPQDGLIIEDIIDGVDLFPTLADVAGVKPADRGSAPRHGQSFADLIGWSDEPLPRRDFTVSSLGWQDGKWVIAIATGDFKLITRAGGAGLTPTDVEEFFDLRDDPDEQRNLIDRGMSDEQRHHYHTLRSALAEVWPAAPPDGAPFSIDVPLASFATLSSNDEWRYEVGVVGHERLKKSKVKESRVLMLFDFTRLIRMHSHQIENLELSAAQIMITFDRDAGGPDDGDIGPIRAYPMLIDWINEPVGWNDIEVGYDPDSPLGMIDLPPHIVVESMGNRHAGIPLPSGAILTLGRAAPLVDVAQTWLDGSAPNFGVILQADWLEEEIGDDQFVHFLPDALLRLQFEVTGG